MKKIKLLSILLCFCLCSSITTGAKTILSEGDVDNLDEPILYANTDLSVGTDLQISAKSAILMEPTTNTVLYEKNASEICAPASITKIMSLVLIMEAIDQKRLTTEEIVTASETASKMGGSQIWLKEGENMTVDDLLKATVIGSANDATVALAEQIAGSEEAFVNLMNKKAEELGMDNTTFKNCTGLDEDGHMTSCYDVAIMSCELLKHPLIKKYSTVWMDTLRDGESELVNTNKLVRFYEGTTGLKTGTTSKAGCCLSASAKRGDTELVAVIMGATNSNERFSGAKKLLDFGFANYCMSEIKSSAKAEDLKSKVKNGTEKVVYGKAENNVKLLLKKEDAQSVEQRLSMEDEIEAPIHKGDTIGTVDVYIGEELVGKIDIKATKQIDKIKYKTTLLWIIKGIFKP